MQSFPDERIRALEQSVQRWRLISLALLLALVSCCAISCTFGVAWLLRGNDFDDIHIMHAERDRAQEERMRAEQAQEELQRVRVEAEIARDQAEAERAKLAEEVARLKANRKPAPKEPDR